MSYIGKTPTVGNFIKLDDITTSSTNSYTLQHNSVNFSPESANHMMVSLNGVIQAPNTSYSVSGSTITFLPSSGTLSSSDSIDFIMVYGNVLDIGTPSDSTVTNAKTNFVSTSSSAGLQIKGDGTTDGTLQLNCSQNSHGIKLKSPPHSASASYTLTFPTTDGNNEEFLQTNGSGTLTWASAGGGITMADQWRVTADINSNANPVSSNWERVDTDGFGQLGTGMTLSSGVFTFPSTGIYYLDTGAGGESNGDGFAWILQTTTDGSSFSEAFVGNMGDPSGYNVTVHGSFIFDVTNTSTHKVSYRTNSMAGNSNTRLYGASDANYIYATFIRLGDT